MDNLNKVEIGSPIWIDQQRAICDAATPGPWEWDIATHLRECRLQTKFNGKRYVMRFVRWGVQEAAPEFQVDCRMIRADKLAKSLPGKEHHIGFDDYIDHPDALFISEARAGWPATLDALEASMAREAEKDATIARCGRKVQFIAQQRDTWRKASERLADHEKDLQQTIAALTESNKDALKDVLYYKAYNDRLRNALSRPERDYLDEIDHLTAERDAEKKRADAAEKDLKTVCTLAIDEGADCACCAVCKHSRGMPPLGSSDDCDILRYDEKTDEIIGKCKWEWRGPCAENAQEGDE